MSLCFKCYSGSRILHEHAEFEEIGPMFWTPPDEGGSAAAGSPVHDGSGDPDEDGDTEEDDEDESEDVGDSEGNA